MLPWQRKQKENFLFSFPFCNYVKCFNNEAVAQSSCFPFLSLSLCLIQTKHDEKAISGKLLMDVLEVKIKDDKKERMLEDEEEFSRA
jgi:hypothetical protein